MNMFAIYAHLYSYNKDSNRSEYKSNFNNNLNNYNQNNRYKTNLTPSLSPVQRMNPLGKSLDQDVNQVRNLKKKYKEDLDYLIELRRRMGEEEFNSRYGNYMRDLERRIQSMEDVKIISKN